MIWYLSLSSSCQHFWPFCPALSSQGVQSETFGACQIWMNDRKLWRARGTKRTIKASPKSWGFIFWAPWRSVQNSMATHPDISGWTKVADRLSNQLTDIASQRAWQKVEYFWVLTVSFPDKPYVFLIVSNPSRSPLFSIMSAQNEILFSKHLTLENSA